MPRQVQHMKISVLLWFTFGKGEANNSARNKTLRNMPKTESISHKHDLQSQTMSSNHMDSTLQRIHNTLWWKEKKSNKKPN